MFNPNLLCRARQNGQLHSITNEHFIKNYFPLSYMYSENNTKPPIQYLVLLLPTLSRCYFILLYSRHFISTIKILISCLAFNKVKRIFYEMVSHCCVIFPQRYYVHILFNFESNLT